MMAQARVPWVLCPPLPACARWVAPVAGVRHVNAHELCSGRGRARSSIVSLWAAVVGGIVLACLATPRVQVLQLHGRQWPALGSTPLLGRVANWAHLGLTPPCTDAR